MYASNRKRIVIPRGALRLTEYAANEIDVNFNNVFSISYFPSDHIFIKCIIYLLATLTEMLAKGNAPYNKKTHRTAFGNR